MAVFKADRGVPRGIEIARYDDEDAALAAVTYLAEHDFPTEHISIVGEGLLMVNDSQGRPSAGQAFVAGASSGVWVGLMAGLIVALFTPKLPLSVILIGSIVSASLVVGLIRMSRQVSARGRSGGVVYARRLVATTYVLVAKARAAEAIRLLSDHAGPRPPARTTQAPAPLTDADGRPKYGVRRGDAEDAASGSGQQE
ncbi:hypothetical protein H8R18_01620 [Nanchangia anserum]|uniref:General stress protein 17M-like domain-containing protein n=1 Tax=Nanchangia anserum TaxID=2692125 RepID=A0A8I0G914_9ACTO|nr:general stress protein [Nanchangia anserum]MBD3690122.1 hypothetical protein [Nanchangia anserum]QOX82094.1 hypothetical protein H8R18_01620 [Nanchangia anserum]